ncbi:MAG: SPASM domain-containing protein [Kiritimatiellae bacterium]|nr:SPASM domain-containing protein [Kiritimatiellia bacterium]
MGSACNLACSYCFYSDHPAGVISERTLDLLLESYNALPFTAKSITLQGGEPLLAPGYVLDKIESLPFARSLQTDATLVTPALAERLKAGNWLVGASLDGSPAHNILRKTKQSKAINAFNDAYAGIKNLERANVDYNLLTVVSSANAANAKDVYTFLRDNFSTRYHQYIECTGPCNEISAEQWGRFLCDLFDEWSKRDAYTVSIRLFDSIVSKLIQGVHTQCTLSPSCSGYLVVEHDGSVYPCDFHVKDNLKLGNITTDSWDRITECAIARQFAAAKNASLREPCASCRYLYVCNGDCPRNRCAGRSVLCEGWKKFFSHSLERFSSIISAMGS